MAKYYPACCFLVPYRQHRTVHVEAQSSDVSPNAPSPKYLEETRSNRLSQSVNSHSRSRATFWTPWSPPKLPERHNNWPPFLQLGHGRWEADSNLQSHWQDWKTFGWCRGTWGEWFALLACARLMRTIASSSIDHSDEGCKDNYHN